MVIYVLIIIPDYIVEVPHAYRVLRAQQEENNGVTICQCSEIICPQPLN